MATSQVPVLKPASTHSTAPHLLLAEEMCPTCDQPIPHDHYDEIKERIETRQRERSAEIATRLQEQHARDKAQALEQARVEGEAKLSAAREEARLAAEAAANERLAVTVRANENAQAALQAKLDEAEAGKSGAEAMVAKIKEEAFEREATVRAEAINSAEAAMQERFAASERRRQETEAALNQRIELAHAGKVAAEAATVALVSKLDQQQQDHAAALETLKSASAARESEIRREAGVAAEAAMQEKLAGLEQANVDAEAKRVLAEQQAQVLQQTHEARLQEQREALEKARDDAVNAEKSAAFEERLKFQTKFEELKRAYDKKSAEELGEGAEVDLYEVLKSEFEGDRIQRINKGQPGADILHTVLHNGKECGKIIYDSKNHSAWRNDFVTKLALDQMAAKAEHAVLSTSKFPAGARQLHHQDGLILASPARVVAVVHLLRQHLVQTHTLRLSNEQRTQKTAALYDFITSERCAGILARIDTHTDDLLDLQVKEKKAHDVTWRKQGELIRSVQRVRGELTTEIDTIVCTVDAPEDVQ